MAGSARYIRSEVGDIERRLHSLEKTIEKLGSRIFASPGHRRWLGGCSGVGLIKVGATLPRRCKCVW
jgi:hypothetical protein